MRALPADSVGGYGWCPRVAVMFPATAICCCRLVRSAVPRTRPVALPRTEAARAPAVGSAASIEVPRGACSGHARSSVPRSVASFLMSGPAFLEVRSEGACAVPRSLECVEARCAMPHWMSLTCLSCSRTVTFIQVKAVGAAEIYQYDAHHTMSVATSRGERPGRSAAAYAASRTSALMLVGPNSHKAMRCPTSGSSSVRARVSRPRWIAVMRACARLLAPSFS